MQSNFLFSIEFINNPKIYGIIVDIAEVNMTKNVKVQMPFTFKIDNIFF